MTTAQHPDDYRASMQVAAAGFIERHQAEHLHDDALFDRTVHHLVTALGVPVFMADRIAYLAMTDRPPVWLGIDMATGPDVTVQHHFQATPAAR